MQRLLRQFFRFFLSDAAKGGDDQQVYLATASEPVAKMWQDILRREGIIAMVITGDPGIPYAGSLASVYQLHVWASQLDRAKAVLEPYIKEQSALPKPRSNSDARQRHPRKRYY
jgi:hypothetical protein